MPKRRRPKGLGTIYQRGNRHYAQAWLPQPDGSKRRVTFSGLTEDAVADQLAAAQLAARRGQPTAPDRAPLAAFLHRWLEDVQRPRVEPSTYQQQALLVRRHLAPGLGPVPLGQLQPPAIQRLYADKLRAGYQPSYVRAMHTILHSALQTALRWGLIARNPAALVEPPAVPRRRPAVLTRDEALHLLATAAGDRLEALYVLLLTVGLRRGEAVGLRWQDVDWRRGRLELRQKHIRVARQLIENPPKGRKERVLDLNPVALEALRRHRTRQAAERLAAGSGWARPDLVFTDRRGRPLNADALRNHYLPRLLARAGLVHRGPHALRHSFASLALEDGADLAQVAQALGHSSPDITLRIYRHFLPTEQGRLAAQMGRLFSEDGADKQPDKQSPEDDSRPGQGS